MMAIIAFALIACNKEKVNPPKVIVYDGAIIIDYTSARVTAEVTDQGGAEVKSRGIAYGKSGGAMDTIFSGSGIGNYSAELNNLEPNTAYVYEAFAKNAGGTGTSGKVSFTTKDYGLPTVETGEVTNPTTTTATGSGNVTKDGGATVTERGLCWSTNHSPKIYDSHVAVGEGLGSFTEEMTGLEPNTTYYVCAYASNSKGTAYGEEVRFFTNPLPTYTISATANPSNGGTVEGGGTFQEGQSCTVKATANTGYKFVNWTDDNVQVSAQNEYTFEVTGNRNLVAHFTPLPYTITATVIPEGSGRIEGIGGYNYGDQCTLTAIANPGYAFVKWTENGSQVSDQSEYTFVVSRDRELVAHFNTVDYTITAISEPAEGGTVSVSGNGGFNFGDPCTLTATPNPGYIFLKWTKGTMEIVTNPYAFHVTESAEYVAHFQPTAINLTVSASKPVIAQGDYSRLSAVATGGNGSYTYSWSPSTGLSDTHVSNPTATPNTTTTYSCTVTSGGQTASGACTITVVCKPTNLNAALNGSNVHLTWNAANPATSYKVYRNNTLIAQNITTTTYNDNNLSLGTYNYQVSAVYQGVESPKSNTVQATIAPQAPTGAINGLFSVSATKQVWFSEGNLQYVGGSRPWKFADNQWQVIGTSQGNSSQSTTRDLFGWGTSGWNCGNTYYRPWDTNNSDGSLYGPPGSYNLTGSYANSDWGVYNTIYSGNTVTTGWRTLTQSEWEYLFAHHAYGAHCVHGQNGVIILPDGMSSAVGFTSGMSGWTSVSDANWTNMEIAGAVFLPAAGSRYETSVSSVGSFGCYWSSSYTNSYNARYVYFYSNYLSTNFSNRYGGFSVRLARPAQ